MTTGHRRGGRVYIDRIRVVTHGPMPKSDICGTRSPVADDVLAYPWSNRCRREILDGLARQRTTPCRTCDGTGERGKVPHATECPNCSGTGRQIVEVPE